MKDEHHPGQTVTEPVAKTPLAPLLPLFVTAGILLAGNGLQGTLVALRGTSEGFSPVLIGIMGGGYFLGFLLACVYSPRMIASVGHIRVFAALAAVAAAGTITLALVIQPMTWIAVRFAMGFCFAGLFTVMESWLGASSHKADRARVFGIYRLVDLGAVTGGQIMLPLVGTAGFEIFAITAILFCLSLVPVALSRGSNPQTEGDVPFDLKTMWLISPIACIGCITIGLTNSAFRTIGPIYAAEIGFDTQGVVLFIVAGIIGGAVLQYPFSWLSDLVDRRIAVIAATAGASLAGLYLTFLPEFNPLLAYLGAFIWGAFALPLYSLSAAHANDRAAPGQFVLIAAGLMFFFSLGAMVGPFASSLVLQTYGPRGFFAYMSLLHGSLILVTMVRMVQRPGKDDGRRTRMVPLLRTSPAIFRLVRSMTERDRGRK